MGLLVAQCLSSSQEMGLKPEPVARPIILILEPGLSKAMLIKRVSYYISPLLNQPGTEMGTCTVPRQRTQLLNNSHFSRLNDHHCHEPRHQDIHPHLRLRIMADKLRWCLPITMEIRYRQIIHCSMWILILSILIRLWCFDLLNQSASPTYGKD